MSEHPEAASGAKREKLNALPYDLIPYQEITDAFARVAEFGAVKYAPWNWSKGLARVQLLGSLQVFVAVKVVMVDSFLSSRFPGRRRSNRRPPPPPHRRCA